METKTLIVEARARFNHNTAKAYLKDKYDSKLVVAEQGGLWKATPELISFLGIMTDEIVVVVDNFENPVSIFREELLASLNETYVRVMKDWSAEWAELETKR